MIKVIVVEENLELNDLMILIDMFVKYVFMKKIVLIYENFFCFKGGEVWDIKIFNL